MGSSEAREAGVLPCVWAQRAVIMGDLLVARAYRAIDGLEDLVRGGEAARRARQRFVAAHYDMCRGELLELMPWRGAPDR